ncbi:hypothetical protein IKH83_02135 [Candidatus Saccharibacteria bacterium]|nr:hypothetical protein [Candidatus Saccharibacteria bacterium]
MDDIGKGGLLAGFVILLLVLLVCCHSCSGFDASWNGSDTAESNEKIQTDFEKIDGYENLYYAKQTKIVYWVGGSYTVNIIGDDYTTSYMTPWYAPNGKPYLYDTTKKELVLIEE